MKYHGAVFSSTVEIAPAIRVRGAHLALQTFTRSFFAAVPSGIGIVTCLPAATCLTARVKGTTSLDAPLPNSAFMVRVARVAGAAVPFRIPQTVLLSAVHSSAAVRVPGAGLSLQAFAWKLPATVLSLDNAIALFPAARRGPHTIDVARAAASDALLRADAIGVRGAKVATAAVVASIPRTVVFTAVQIASAVPIGAAPALASQALAHGFFAALIVTVQVILVFVLLADFPTARGLAKHVIRAASGDAFFTAVAIRVRVTINTYATMIILFSAIVFVDSPATKITTP